MPEDDTNMSNADAGQTQRGGEPSAAATERDLRLPSALVRTALSSEQSLMSWIRTSISLYTFGISITKFFQYLAEEGGSDLSAGPRRLGFGLICVGMLAMALGLIEYVRWDRSLKAQGLPKSSLTRYPVYSAIALLVIGVAALFFITVQ